MRRFEVIAFKFTDFLEFLKSILSQIEKNTNIFSFSSEIECNRKQMNNY